jgi:nucleoside-diphosphate-sugar epimerase
LAFGALGMKTRLVIGCGYLGSRVAQRWRAAGGEVFAVTRLAARAAILQQSGLRPVVADVTMPGTLASLPAADSVLYAVGHDRAAGPSMRDVYVTGLRAVLDNLAGRVGRLIYISSSGVYGQNDGSWVDETTVCQPTRESGHVCLEAEGTLAAHSLAERAVVLRLAGIYGPGRLPNRAALLAGEPIAASPQGYLNLIHVDDAAAVALAVAEHPSPAALYLVSDGHPIERQEYYAEAARLLGAPPPRFVAPAADSPKAARAESNRRVSNARMLADLGVRLTYPTFREGLAAAFVEEARL